jgi:hypothetical protein
VTGLDVLVVASHRDYEITTQCLRNLIAYMPCRGKVYLATDQPQRGQELLDSLRLTDVTLVPDEQILSAAELELPGWYKQQIIKLRSGMVLSGDVFCVLSGDTLLGRTLTREDLISSSGRPYLYVNRYRYLSLQLAYERRRVRAMAKLLNITPTVSLVLGDFINDVFCFERVVLDTLTQRLHDRFGRDWTHILAGRDARPADQQRFGEYAAYALAALELYAERPPVRICRETHVLQIHNRRSLRLARFEAPIVHIVDKSIPLAEITQRAAAFGQDLLPPTGEPVFRSSPSSRHRTRASPTSKVSIVRSPAILDRINEGSILRLAESLDRVRRMLKVRAR